MIDPNIECSSHGKVRDDEMGFPKYHYCDPAVPLNEAYSKSNPWNGASFGAGGLGDQTPVMPSSEAHFFDYSQRFLVDADENLLEGSGINSVLSPRSAVAEAKYSAEWWNASGVYQTFGADVDTSAINEDQSGIFHFDNLKGRFSVTGTKDVAADFNIFNPFIYHEDLKTEDKIEIPYVSDYLIATPYYPYPY